jgi:hypothetical protein
MSNSDSGLLARLPGGQDSHALVNSPNDEFITNAEVLLRPVAKSEGVVLKASPDSNSMPDLWFDYEDEELRSIREWSSGVQSKEVATGLDAIIRFAHTYGHDSHEFSAEPIEEAPEVFQ